MTQNNTVPDVEMQTRRMCGTCRHMLSRQVVDGVVVGYLHSRAADDEHDVVPVKPSVDVPPEYVCDFCGEADPGWAFRARPFMVRGMQSMGDWLACEACRDLIVFRQRGELLDRTVAILGRSSRMPRRILRRGLAELQSGFYTHREGHPVPVVAGEVIE